MNLRVRKRDTETERDIDEKMQKDSWKAELKEFSSNNGYDLNKNGDSAALLLDVLEGFLKYELALKLIDTEQFRRIIER
ncbi:Protein TONNEAU 1a [Camellia lanceoleosa]|uniref:Protein TONNEAU 1a n=1 Tax=Camellia lanceoleosa TaxID=1840588 RepID=A0ACC0FZ50_9ERIC|nr:Protein TONNEAU 1a [Camellia lanceoleosa]